ncbi:hypothetical protein NCC49_001379 [Naganishia albida]|nr:hypothetical protein NCC49_001379 [Naganishia albida]
MPYHALSTPATLEKRSSPESHRRFPDHAYSPLFTTGILNSAQPVEHGKISQHLTFRQEAKSTPRKHQASSKSGLPSSLSTSTLASPSIKKKQSSTSLARSLASSQSGSIPTPRKALADKDGKGSGKPKSEWWRGRSSTFGGKDVRDDKAQGGRTGWLRQSDVWMSEGINTERVAHSRTDGLPALPTYRPLLSVPLDKENIPLRSTENPIIKKKSSLGAFRFKNFFQPSKIKESITRADSQPKVQSFLLSPKVHPNQPGHHAVSPDAYTTGHAHSLQSSVRPSSHQLSTRSNARPRLPLLTTSMSRFNQSSSPYSAEPAFPSPHGTLPYMAGAGDGWNTPFPTRCAIVSSRADDSVGYPFPAVTSHRAKHDPQDHLAVPPESAGHERAPSAAFEYQEFETSLRNSGQLSSIHGSGEESDKENTTT